MTDLCLDLARSLPQLSLGERFAAAARLGFGAVEFSTVTGLAPAELSLCARRSRMSVISVGLGPITLQPTDAALSQAFDCAQAAGALYIAVAVDLPAADLRARANLVERLRHIADMARNVNTCVLVDIAAGSRPVRFGEAIKLLNEVGVRNISLLGDVGGIATAGDSLDDCVRRYLSRIGHIRLGDDRTETDICAALSAIDAAGYRGWVGCGGDRVTDANRDRSWLAPHLRDPARGLVWGLPRDALRATGLATALSDRSR